MTEATTEFCIDGECGTCQAKPDPSRRTLLFVGPSGCGKDEACRYLSRITPLVFWGSTSQVIALEISRREKAPLNVVYGNRHHDRARWRAIGDEMRANDPAALLRVCLDHGADLLNGTRARPEIEAAEGLVDLIVWIDRPGLPDDPTLEFGPEVADVIVPNAGTLDQFRSRLRNFATALRLA